jgi:predicted TIM-barrel fold metal-dependent hydrolase
MDTMPCRPERYATVRADVVGRAEVVDMLAPQYPDVVFIIPHLGSFADDWRAQGRIVDQLARYPNVFTDTSGVRRFDYIVEAVKRAGAHKVLFGSDGPWLHPGLELHKIKLLGLPPDKEALILGGNVLRLLRRARVGQAAPQGTAPARRIERAQRVIASSDGIPLAAQPDREL